VKYKDADSVLKTWVKVVKGADVVVRSKEVSEHIQLSSVLDSDFASANFAHIYETLICEMFGYYDK
jgi:hypothetical protein